MNKPILGYVIGYMYAVIVGCLCTTYLVNEMWRCIGWKGVEDKELRPNAWRWQPILVGILERILYMASLQEGYGEFVGIWLLFKVAARWSRWEQPTLAERRRIEGHSVYQIFIIGNAISILFAVIGFVLIKLVSTNQLQETLVISISPIVATFLAKLWLYKLRIKENSKDGRE